MSNSNEIFPELVFLGTGAAIQIPAFFCGCETCEAARKDKKQQRTRASAALIGQECVVIDPGPDIEFQLERESIRRVNRIFITHWHYDHVWGLGAFGEPPSLAGWSPIHIYLPEDVVFHFDQELSYIKRNVILHSVHPGDRIKLPDATWEIVKTTHNEHSIGFIVESRQKFAYILDSVVPPSETVERLTDLDILILEGTMDELCLKEGIKWMNFSVQEAIDFWQQLGTKKCVLTHLSCHSWNYDHLVSGFTITQRFEYEARYSGLRFAHDGMRIQLI
ncbi:MAG: MBL fold metallo-hydrolase [Candidatus Hodarchaeota archaeon]